MFLFLGFIFNLNFLLFELIGMYWRNEKISCGVFKEMLYSEMGWVGRNYLIVI